MRIRDWSSDVCSSDLCRHAILVEQPDPLAAPGDARVLHVDMDLPRPLAARRTSDQERTDRERQRAIADVPARALAKTILAGPNSALPHRRKIVPPPCPAAPTPEMPTHPPPTPPP